MFPILYQSLWRDEAFSAILSQHSPWQIVLLSMKQDPTPFLYYLLLHFWTMVFGTSEVSIRGLSVLFHLLIVLIVFLLSKKIIKSPVTRIFITLITLLNPFLLQYAFEARAYNLLGLLSLMAIYFIASKKYLLASICLALAIFTHNFTVFTVIAIATWFIYSNKTKPKSHLATDALHLFGLPVLSILIWSSVIWRQWLTLKTGFWIKPVTPLQLLNFFKGYSTGNFHYPAQPILYILSLLLIFFAVSYWVWWKKPTKEKNNSFLQLIDFVIIIPTLITYCVSVLYTPIYFEKYLITTTPLLIILIAYSIHQFFKTSVKVRYFTIPLIALYISAILRSDQQIFTTITKPPINFTVSQILSKAKPGDIIIPEDILNVLETKWYVIQHDSRIPVYAYTPNNQIPFYVGSIFYEPQEVITQIPKNVRIWRITPSGKYYLLPSD